jgi:uncharacterized membrane protein YjjP (DUF1212 family)
MDNFSPSLYTVKPNCGFAIEKDFNRLTKLPSSYKYSLSLTYITLFAYCVSRLLDIVEDVVETTSSTTMELVASSTVRIQTAESGRSRNAFMSICRLCPDVLTISIVILVLGDHPETLHTIDLLSKEQRTFA